MDTELENIKKMLIKICELEAEDYKIRHDTKYKCENFETYEHEHEKICSELINIRNSFCNMCNDYINYPEKKFLFFNRTEKIEFKDEDFIGLVLNIPPINKQEYYCLINLFEHMPKHIRKLSSNKTEWMLRHDV